MRVIARTFFLLPTVFVVWGCRAPVAPDGPAQVTMRISDREAFLDAAASELRRRDFPIARIDLRQGVLVTRPATSQQWFEFWRRDSLGAYQIAESSTHTIRRRVTVELKLRTPTEPGPNPTRKRGAAVELEQQTSAEPEEYAVSVLVEKERFSAPERQVTSATGALAVFSDHLPTVEGVMGPRSLGAHWVPLGRDPLLEADLLERITGLAPVEAPAPEHARAADSVSISEPEPPADASHAANPKPAPKPKSKRSSVSIEVIDE